MNKTRAKFVVKSILKTTYGCEIEMTPVVSGSVENVNFFKWTPSGSLKMGIVSQFIEEKFTPGREFYLDFTEANENEI